MQAIDPILARAPICGYAGNSMVSGAVRWRAMMQDMTRIEHTAIFLNRTMLSRKAAGPSLAVAVVVHHVVRPLSLSRGLGN